MYLTNFWFLLLIFSVFQISSSCKQEENLHSTYLNIKKNHKFHGRTIKIVLAEDMTICGQLCLREKKCVSFNFKNRGKEKQRKCELKDSKPHIGSMSNSHLTYNDKYDYVLIQRVSLLSLSLFLFLFWELPLDKRLKVLSPYVLCGRAWLA